MISEFKYINATAASTNTIFTASGTALGQGSFTLERLLICNTDSTDITVRVSLEDGSNTIHILYDTVIPIGVTLDVLDGIPLVYDSFNLVKIITGSGHTADVIANRF
tara:strand:- start:217 stop:537 length:321 start_codon:yes stop_codon:yes gene_type:complete